MLNQEIPLEHKQYEQFEVSVLKDGDVTECAKLLAESFVDVEPYKTFAMSIPDLTNIFHEITLKSVSRQYSFVVRAKQSNELAACCITYDALDDDKVQVKAANPEQYRAIVALLFKMTEQHEKECEVEEEGHSAYIWDLAVAKEFRGRKLTRLLLNRTLEALKRRKYKMAYVEMVSPLTEQTFIKSTKYFQEINRLKMKDFQIDGKKPWANVEDQCVYAGCELENLKLQL